MSERATQLMRKAERQLDDLVEFFAKLDETDLAKPYPERRGKNVADAAAHVAEGYHFMGGFLAREGYVAGPAGSGHGHGERPSPVLADMRRRLDEARARIASLAGLSDDQLGTVPPAKSSRFSDGRRTLEQVIEAVIAHQPGYLKDRGCIGALTVTKFFCNKALGDSRGVPRCRHSVAQKASDLHA